MTTTATSPELSPQPVPATARSRFYTCIHTGHASTRVRTRAQILLKLGRVGA